MPGKDFLAAAGVQQPADRVLDHYYWEIRTSTRSADTHVSRRTSNTAIPVIETLCSSIPVTVPSRM